MTRRFHLKRFIPLCLVAMLGLGQITHAVTVLNLHSTKLHASAKTFINQKA